MPGSTAYSTKLGQALKPPVTYRDIAREAGVSYSFVCKVAQGVKPCSEKVARAIHELLGIDADAFFRDSRG